MPLTPAQSANLKTYILSQPDLAPLTSGTGTDFGAIVAALNANANPATLGWLASAPTSAIDDAPDYSAFDAIVPGKRDSWGFFLRADRNFTRSKIRKWVTDVWGNATAGSSAEAILQAATEPASRAEVALGGTTKQTGSVTALDRNWIGDVQISDISAMFVASLVAQ